MQQSVTIPNENYIRKLIGGKKVDLYKSSASKRKPSIEEKRARIQVECITNAMAKYDTPWWLSDDLQKIAYYQINETVLLVTFDKFKEAVSYVIGRKIESNNPMDLLAHKNAINKRFIGKF